jgi:hypothetical protein
MRFSKWTTRAGIGLSNPGADVVEVAGWAHTRSYFFRVLESERYDRE